jgi:hypothetical protein
MLTVNYKTSQRKLKTFILQLFILIMLIPFTGLAQNSPDSILPVTISSIKAYPFKSGINLDWFVTQQLETNRYEVEKSEDGTTFTKVGTIMPNLTTGSVAYNWFDPNPGLGNNYYRIKMFESTLLSSYTKIVEARISNGGSTTMSVYPNPLVGSTLNVKVTNTDKATSKLIISNNLGQIVSNKVVELEGVPIPVDVYNLKPGIYQVTVGGMTAQVVRL